MANTTISPNMNLPVPVVSVDPGVDWANNVNACLNAIDSHNHSTGQGVQITPDGLNISSDLTMAGNDLTTVRSVRFSAQSAPIAVASDVGCIYESGVDLYYNDGSGNQVRITQGGAVTGATGTITGLPSGTASASFSAGTFTFQSATNTPATMAVGPLVIGAASASPKTVTLGPSGAQSANYNLTFPAAAPATGQILQSDGSGNLSWTTNTLGRMPVGGVIATFPNTPGAYSTAATTVADAAGFVLCAGQVIADASSPMNGSTVPNLNNGIFVLGNTVSGSSGGASSVTLITANLPSHTHGAGSYQTSLSATFPSATHVHDMQSHRHGMAHTHQWSYSSVNNRLTTLVSSSTASTSIGALDTVILQLLDSVTRTASSNGVNLFANGSTTSNYTTGVLDSPIGSGASAFTDAPSVTNTGTPTATSTLAGSNTVTGTSGAAGSGTSFQIYPPYIAAVYLMRIK